MGAPVHQGDFCQRWWLQDFLDGLEDGGLDFALKIKKIDRMTNCVNERFYNGKIKETTG